jgi:nucleoside-diphosphate-sugar epimerase
MNTDNQKKSALVLGGGGFIGNHLVKRLKEKNYWVRAVDIKLPEYGTTQADEFVISDLRKYELVEEALNPPHNTGIENFDEVYQLAADMGGAGYIFTGLNDADILHNSAQINLNVLNVIAKSPNKLNIKIFYSSSACIYPAENQENTDNPDCREFTAYPANPDSEYGWEKLFSERLFLAYNRNYGIKVAIARFHNIFGPEGTYKGGKEKAPAAICRKIAEAKEFGTIEIWGDGNQTRSFLYIDDCLDAVLTFMGQDSFIGPVNIGSEEMVSINELAEIVNDIAHKKIKVEHIDGPLGVRGRNSNNDLIREKLGWNHKSQLRDGLNKTYKWIESQTNLVSN